MSYNLTVPKTKLSPEQKAEICARYAQGESSTALKNCFDVSTQAICYVLKINGVQTRTPKESHPINADKKSVFALYNSGEPMRQIAQEFGISRLAVSKILAEFGVKTRLTACEKQAIGELYQQGKDFAELGERFSCDPSSIGNALKSLGISARKGTPPAKALKSGCKQCSDCKKPKRLKSFYPLPGSATKTTPRCRQCSRAYLRKWREENPDLVRAQWRQSGSAKRARKRNAQGKHTLAEWRKLCAFYGNRCLCCNATGALTRDHIIPLSCGGGNDISNIQPLCISCNVAKGVKSTDYRP